MPKIMLVEDDEIGRFAFRSLLDSAGCEVVDVENGLEAVRKLQEIEFDIVITDVFMPEMDGVELIREIREAFPEMKVVAVSGGGGGFTAAHTTNMMSNLGADAVLQKPVTNKELLAVVDTLTG